MNEDIYAIFREKAQIASLGDTSLRTETVREIMASIEYVLSRAPEGLTDGDVLVQFAAGEKRVLADVERARKLRETAVNALLPLNVDSYRGVPDSFTSFFLKYRWDLFAHVAPCLVDYQLACPVEDERGVTYVTEYLTRFLIENAFLSRRPIYFIEEIISKVHPDWRKSVLNIYEDVLIHEYLSKGTLDGIVPPGVENQYAQRVITGQKARIEILRGAGYSDFASNGTI